MIIIPSWEMENYHAEPVLEHYADPFPFDIENDPSYFLIKLDNNKSSRIRTLVNRGTKNFGPGKKIVFIAQGRSTAKAVNCVEIMKTYYKKPIYQITRINQIRTIETWYPMMEGLDPIRITRGIPVIYILISLEKLTTDEDGYQVYNHRDPKRLLNMQVVETEAEAETRQDSTGSNTDLTTIEQKENLPTISPPIDSAINDYDS